MRLLLLELVLLSIGLLTRPRKVELKSRILFGGSQSASGETPNSTECNGELGFGPRGAMIVGFLQPDNRAPFPRRSPQRLISSKTMPLLPCNPLK